MRRYLLGLVVVTAVAVVAWAANPDGLRRGPVASLQSPPESIRPVYITNLPESQTIDGAIEVLNLPEVQEVTGAVAVSGVVEVSNYGNEDRYKVVMVSSILGPRAKRSTTTTAESPPGGLAWTAGYSISRHFITPPTKPTTGSSRDTAPRVPVPRPRLRSVADDGLAVV